MTRSEPVIISAAVEGDLDEALARRLIVHAGGVPGAVYGRNGKAALRQKIGGYNNAARRTPWLVLVDLDHTAPCAAQLVTAWLPDREPLLRFRVAVREVQAWLLADRESLADYLRVTRGQITNDPEALPDPKRSLVDLARRSRNRDIRADMVPREGSGRSIGPAYVSRVIEFIERRWRPDVAAGRADSLGRALACLQRRTKSRP